MAYDARIEAIASSLAPATPSSVALSDETDDFSDLDTGQPRVVSHLVDGKPVLYWLDPKTGILRPLTEAELAEREAWMAEIDELDRSTTPEPSLAPATPSAVALSDEIDQDATTVAAAQSKPPPTMAARARKQGREWIWLPAPAIVYQTYPTVEEKTLKTGTWYQMKENDDGSRDFYNGKGNWIGTNPPNEREQVVVRKEGDRPKK